MVMIDPPFWVRGVVSLPSCQLASGLPARGATSHVVLKRCDGIYTKCCTPLDEFNDIDSSFATFNFGDESLSVSQAFCERGLADVRPFPQIAQEGQECLIVRMVGRARHMLAVCRLSTLESNLE